MKLLFLILAHNRPDQTAELAKALVQAAEHGTAFIHFDAGATENDFNSLGDFVSGSKNIQIISNRVRCKWGDYSLVQAVLSSLIEIKEKKFTFDYVVLLSGSCLPVRSIKKLERFLKSNLGKEFIEISDPAWIVDGLRSERFELYYPFSANPGSFFEKVWTSFQKAIGIKRRVPRDLSPKFGSQWWVLTWQTCIGVTQYLLENKEVARFFRSTYIPDEIVFPTIVNAICGKRDISGFNLTAYLFTERGKPAVFYDDHLQIANRLNKFFFRKVSPDATLLRRKYLAVAAHDDDGETLEKIGNPNSEYRMKMTAQTHFPRPGQIFYRDNYLDSPEGILKNLKKPYVVVFGQDARVSEILSRISSPSLANLGRLFSPSVDPAGGWDEVLGMLRNTSFAVRDAHPALFLARVRTRIDGVTAFGWCPGDSAKICKVVASDPNALCILSLQNDRDLFGAEGLFSSPMVGGTPADKATKAFEIVTGAGSAILDDRIIIDVAGDRRSTASGARPPISTRFSDSNWFAAIAKALEEGYQSSIDEIL